MASVSAAHVSVSVLVSEVLALSTGSREPASGSRPASRPNLDGLSLGLGHPCLDLGLGLGRSRPRLQRCCKYFMLQVERSKGEIGVLRNYLRCFWCLPVAGNILAAVNANKTISFKTKYKLYDKKKLTKIPHKL